MQDPLAETWLINHRATLLLLANVPEEALAMSISGPGSRTIGQQFAHVCDVRNARLHVADPELAASVAPIAADDSHAQSRLIHGLTTSANAIAALITRSGASGGRVIGFKRGITALVGYLIAHEAHHRGAALLTLERSGVPLGEQVRFGLWDWNTI